MKFYEYLKDDEALSTAANVISHFEGFSGKAYKCPAGVLTIGYGHTGDVKQGDTITEKEALALLKKDVLVHAAGLAKAITADVTDGQFASIVSLAYNVGVNAVKKSKLVKKLNAGDIAGAAEEFDWVTCNGQVLKGLVRRRAYERRLFLGEEA